MLPRGEPKTPVPRERGTCSEILSTRNAQERQIQRQKADWRSPGAGLGLGVGQEWEETAD